jgi:Zn finger protein HypA/HybF involved in hydrogenase expression
MCKLILKAALVMIAVVGTQAFAANTMKPHHQAAGLKCNSCHATTPFQAVSTDQCVKCHQLPQKKTDYHGAPDKHDSPHYGPTLDCDNCHHEHEASENYCNNCHDFDFKVP